MPHENPIKPRELWAYENKDRFWYASAHRRFVSACAGDATAGIVRVLATEDPTGQYYGWLDFRDDDLDYIWPSEGQRDMCFPYGPAEEERRGRGLALAEGALRKQAVDRLLRENRDRIESELSDLMKATEISVSGAGRAGAPPGGRLARRGGG